MPQLWDGFNAFPSFSSFFFYYFLQGSQQAHLEPDTVPLAVPWRVGTSESSSHPDAAVGEGRDPEFAVTALVLQIPFRAAPATASVHSQQQDYSGVRNHLLAAGIELVDVLASAPVQHFRVSIVFPVRSYLEQIRRRR